MSIKEAILLPYITKNNRYQVLVLNFALTISLLICRFPPTFNISEFRVLFFVVVKLFLGCYELLLAGLDMRFGGCNTNML